jgi:hypothetical protein
MANSAEGDQDHALAEKLSALETVSLDGLRKQCQAAFGQPPPPRLNRGWLVGILAYHVQERILGGV